MGPLNYFVAGATNLIDQYGCYGILQDMRLQDSFKIKGVDAVRVKPRPQSPSIPTVYGGFDVEHHSFEPWRICFWFFPPFHSHPPTHACVCHALFRAHSYRLLIGACNPM